MLLRLAWGRDAAALVSRMIAHRDAPLGTHADRCRLADAFGPENIVQYLAFRRALAPEAAGWDELSARLAALFTPGVCYNTATLAVNGGDLLRAGFVPGPALGAALRALTDAVVAGRLPNEKAALLDAARRL